MCNIHWNARRNLDSHVLWQFVFTAADGDAEVCHGSGGRSQIWKREKKEKKKIMEMYLCRRCFISVRALWRIKISLCLWEEKEREREDEEGRGVCADDKKTGCESFFSSSPLPGWIFPCTSTTAKKKKKKLPRRNVTKRCDARADVSLSRRPAAESKIPPLLISAALPSLPPSLENHTAGFR